MQHGLLLNRFAKPFGVERIVRRWVIEVVSREWNDRCKCLKIARIPFSLRGKHNTMTANRQAADAKSTEGAGAISGWKSASCTVSQETSTVNDTVRLMRLVAFVALPVVLAACTGNVREQAVAPVRTTVPAAAEMRSNAPGQKALMIQRLLAQGDAAFKRGRYTLPEGDNALDRYRAVLMLDPENPDARAGLDSVLLAYIDHVRSVLSAGYLGNAKQLLQRAGDVFIDTPVLQDLREDIEREEARRNAQEDALADTEIPPGEKTLLPKAELEQRSDDIVITLTALAQRVRESNESVMIMARSDREGRWIYKVMQDAAKDYRIRGDIRVSRIPAVVLMAPL